MPQKIFAVLIITLWVLTCPHNSFAANIFTKLKSPYPSMVYALNRLEDGDKTCSTPPPPPTLMNFTSIYTDKTEGTSIIDATAESQYRQQTNTITQFETQIYKWIETGFKNDNNNTRAPIACAIDWLYDWANNNAMVGIDTSSQGEATRKWTLASLSSQYIQIRNTNWIEPEKRKVIDDWLYTLAAQVMKDYSRDMHRTSRNNNHQYWAAWSVMITGVALNEPKFYKWGIQNYKKAMRQIEKDGTLPLETARKGKAFHYHLFATSPLLMMAETAKVNGLNLYKYRQNSLLKLINLDLAELENNQEYLTAVTGTAQDLTGTITPRQLAWLVPYRLHYKNIRADRWIKNLNPMIQRRIGGDLSRIYSAAE